MEFSTMSAEELALSFSNQSQKVETKVETPLEQTNPFKRFEEMSSKSSEELAAEAIKNPTLVEKKEEDKTEEEKAAALIEAKAKEALASKVKIDDSFKQGLDKLFKEQKLNPYSDGTKEGYIIPETWEDVIELIEDNKKSWVEGSKAKDKQELFNDLLSTKSPAWQFVLQNSELYKDPADLVPLLTAVQNIEYSDSLDVTNQDDQIKIVRATLSIQGLATTDIESEIEDLKERGKLETRATSLKPILDRYNESQAEKVLQEKQQEDLKKSKFWNDYYQNLENSVFKAKDIDGVKLKNEHKQLVASTLIPDEKLGGLPIYTMIDNLVAAGDFNTLTQIVLLGTDKELYDSYFLSKKADIKVEGVQKVLRQIGTSASSSDLEDFEDSKPKPIKKSSYGFFG